MPSPCSADTGMGSPKPNDQASSTPCSPARPSALLASTTIAVSVVRSQRAISSSSGVRPTRASMTKAATVASATAAIVWARIRPGSVSTASSSYPAVSITRKSRP